MKYMFLIYSQRSGEPDPAKSRADMARHWEVIDDATRQNRFIAVQPLAPAAAATTIRVNEGKPFTIDGPFAETKEQLGGFYILECQDLDEAIQWAARIPAGCGGSGCIEIRPVAELPQRP